VPVIQFQSPNPEAPQLAKSSRGEAKEEINKPKVPAKEDDNPVVFFKYDFFTFL